MTVAATDCPDFLGKPTPTDNCGAKPLLVMKAIEDRWRNRPQVGIGYVGGNKDRHRSWIKKCSLKADKAHVWVEEAKRWLDEAW